ncbi:MAG: DUF5106 domain-containing protein, partial [Bacteroidetes bacterium]|nr:DUF5106 domain-containing protein [Bacteroidota bacterium]
MRFAYRLVLLWLLLTPLAISKVDAGNNGHKIDVRINGLKNDTAYLARYFGSNMYYADTSQIDASGRVTFSGSEPLLVGVYAVIYKRMKLFEFIVNDQKIGFETDTSGYVKNLKIFDSNENQIFYDWQ